MNQLEIIWTAQAFQDLQEIAGYLADHSPSAAQKLMDRVIDFEETLLRFPEIGKSLGYLGYPNNYKFVMPPYVVDYRLENQQIQILQFVDGRRLRENK